MPIELRHLRYFIVVADELSFTAAASRLHMSQPPLSQQIRDLERQVGTALFRRTSRRVGLTAAGESFLVHARAILSQLDGARHEAQAIGAGKVGRLFIGSTGSISPSSCTNRVCSPRSVTPTSSRSSPRRSRTASSSS